MGFATFHPAHGALAGLAVYAITGKPVPSLVVGGSLYMYMSVYGHSLPPGIGGAPAAGSMSANHIVDIPHGLHPTMLAPLGYVA